MTILASNGLVLLLALWQNWPFLGLLFPFLIENFVIGGFVVARLLHGARENLPCVANGRQLDNPVVMRLVMAAGFGFVYGMFNLGFFSMLGDWSSLKAMFQVANPADESSHRASVFVVVGFIVMTLVMIWHYYQAYRRSMVIDRIVPLDITRLLVFPAIRIMVIHFSILLSGSLIITYITGGLDGTRLDANRLTQLLIVLFVVIKTAFDLWLNRQVPAPLQERR